MAAFAGFGGLYFFAKKVKLFIFSCMLVVHRTVITILKFVAQ